MKLTGCCLPYGESKYHDAVMPGAFAHQDGQSVPLVQDFFSNDPDNIIGHCVLHDASEGVMCDIYFNESYLTEAMKSYDSIENLYWAVAKLYNIGAWAVRLKCNPVINHTKSGSSFVVIGGEIRAVSMNRYGLEEIKIVEE